MAESKPANAQSGETGIARQGAGAGNQQASFLPADQHFVRQVVLALVQGRALASTSAIDESRVDSLLKQAKMILQKVKEAESAAA